MSFHNIIHDVCSFWMYVDHFQEIRVLQYKKRQFYTHICKVGMKSGRFTVFKHI